MPRDGALPLTRHGPRRAGDPGAGPQVGDPAGARSTPAQPVFYYDLSSIESYLAAERVMTDLGEVPEWQPVLAAQLAGAEGLDRKAVQTLASERGMQPLRWPDPYPFDARAAMLAATYAKQIGRTVAFSLAAFRQAFAAGRALDTDTILIAGAACEMHPRALQRALGTRAVAQALDEATAAAAAIGVRSMPALRAGDRVLHGDAAIEQAARLLRRRAAEGGA